MFKELDRLISDKTAKILFTGTGNVLKSDDGAGVYISERIINKDNIYSITVETGIERYIGKINSLSPDILVLIDCVEMKMPPGSFKLLKINQIQDLTFNTHNISFKKLSEFFPMPVYILAIQPEKIDFGKNLSYIVKDISNKILKQINRQEV